MKPHDFRGPTVGSVARLRPHNGILRDPGCCKYNYGGFARLYLCSATNVHEPCSPPRPLLPNPHKSYNQNQLGLGVLSLSRRGLPPSACLSPTGQKAPAHGAAGPGRGHPLTRACCICPASARAASASRLAASMSLISCCCLLRKAAVAASARARCRAASAAGRLCACSCSTACALSAFALSSRPRSSGRTRVLCRRSSRAFASMASLARWAASSLARIASTTGEIPSASSDAWRAARARSSAWRCVAARIARSRARNASVR
eukprot:scaffold4066_cov107-Isochrysis_galbana.AAC.3